MKLTYFSGNASLDADPPVKTLLTHLKVGNKSAFVHIYNTYHNSLYGYALRFVKIPQVAEDIVQEVFIKVWDRRSNIDPSLSFKSYLFTITRNAVFKQLKKIAADDQMRTEVALHIGNKVADPALQLQWQQYNHILTVAIERLPPQRKRVFKLCRLEGKKYEEVATELNLTRNTVKEHMVLAVRSIREYVGHHADMQLMLAVSVAVMIN
ncbi:RNA polymerase sigma factor [Pinibacter soli]|uniref:RNA polymerase sigma factor n=1 Tax=Pinibacter soli TaxID=3044211 RepID=A0ABT6REM9_9BACT|nr:RNA polymerase sigma-70 factor [Pinibacter soli]MDI3320871.1 RNA polymerase sigma-70 factor [Pinibacter soli]